MSDSARYTIEVGEEFVEITGTLTIREAFDFLSFFEKEGFTTLEDWGDGTTLYLRKRDLERERQDQIIKNTVEDNEFYKEQYHKELENKKDLLEKLNSNQILTKKIMEDASDKIKYLEKRLEEYKKEDQRYKALLNLKNSPDAAKIMSWDEPIGEENPPFSPLSEGNVE